MWKCGFDLLFHEILSDSWNFVLTTSADQRTITLICILMGKKSRRRKKEGLKLVSSSRLKWPVRKSDTQNPVITNVCKKKRVFRAAGTNKQIFNLNSNRFFSRLPLVCLPENELIDNCLPVLSTGGRVASHMDTKFNYGPVWPDFS